MSGRSRANPWWGPRPASRSPLGDPEPEPAQPIDVGELLNFPNWELKTLGEFDHGRYILDLVGEPVPEPDLLTWAHWMEENRATAGWLAHDDNEYYRISTIFLGLDHNHLQRGNPPILFETMVFLREVDEDGFHRELDQQRYSTRDGALIGHQEMCQKWLTGEKLHEDRVGDVHGGEDP